MKIFIRSYGDSYYDSGTECYVWNGQQWYFLDEGLENEKGMMGAPRAEFCRRRMELHQAERLDILRHFGLTEGEIPLDKVPTSSPEYLLAIASAK